MSDESPQEIILKHRLSKQFVSHYSDGIILNGPGPSGLWTMIFYAESFGIEFEKLKKEKDQYKIKLEESSQGYFREDQARIAMTEKGLRNLYTILKSRFEAQ
jgi:hypothetical protein